MSWGKKTYIVRSERRQVARLTLNEIGSYYRVLLREVARFHLSFKDHSDIVLRVGVWGGRK